MKLFRQEVTVYATIYVRAEDEGSALTKAQAFVNEGLSELDGPEISGADFSSPDLPEVSLSPAMSFGDLVGEIEENDL